MVHWYQIPLPLRIVSWLSAKYQANASSVSSLWLISHASARHAAPSPAGVPGGVPTLVPLSKTTIDPLSKLDNRRGSLIDGSVESELSALRSELVSQRKATESLASEMRSMKSQMNSQLANLTHIVMLMSNSSGTAGGSSARGSSNSGRETRGDAEESPGTGTEGGPSPAVRQRTKSGKDRGRRMSLNALTTAGV